MRTRLWSILTLPCTTHEARADRRLFAFSYPYATLPKGGFEVEYYLDAGFRRADNPATPTILESRYRPAWEHQLEFEYGITDKLDFGFYNVFRQSEFGSFGYRGAKLRSRYRFFEQGEHVVDPSLYLEVGYFGDEIELEQRLILSRRFGRFEASLNLTLEQEIELGAEAEVAFLVIPSVGAGYHLSEHVALSLEYFGRVKIEEGALAYSAHYLGPTLSVMGRHFWWTVSFQSQLTSVDSRPRFLARSIFAIVL